MTLPSRLPPASSRPPADSALSIHSATRSALASSMSGPQMVSSIGRVAPADGRGGLDQLAPQGDVDVFVGQYPLHRDAGLPGVTEGGAGDLRGHHREITGVGLDDHRGIAAEFEGDPAFPGDLLEVPTDLHGTGEGQGLEAFIDGQDLGVGSSRGDHRQRARRQSRRRRGVRPA